MPDTTKIVHAAMMVRAQAPDSWESFVLAMREYAAATAAEMVRCAPEQLQRAQGMAIATHELSATLMNAPQIYDTIQSRGRHGRQP